MTLSEGAVSVSAVDGGDWLRVETLEKLEREGQKVVRGADRPIVVFAHEGKISAVDNRCPHLGFPLNAGTVRDGILTCHWHQARFDLCSGCTFDLWADDVPSFETRVRDGVVFVRSLPRQRAGMYLRQLVKGLSQNVQLLQAKGLVGMLAEGASDLEVVRQILNYSLPLQNGGGGLTELAIGANLSPMLGSDTRYFMLFRGTQQIAQSVINSQRPMREPLAGEKYPFETLKRWFYQWVKVRDRDAAERVLLTAIANGATPGQLAEMLFGADSQRIYAGFGHSFDLTNKIMELLDHVGWDSAAKLLPLVLGQMTAARGTEEDGRWLHPVNLADLIRNAEADLPELLRKPRSGNWRADAAFSATLLGEDPAAIVGALRDALAAGAAPEQLSAHVALAAATRLATFSNGNEVGDWFNPQHTLNYANAVDQALRRCPAPEVVRALFHAALSVYMDRYLNVPAAKLPRDGAGLDDLPSDAEALRAQLLEVLDGRSMVNQAARIVARYVGLQHPVGALVDALAMGTLREDLDFHTLQVLEAGVRQAGNWGNGPEVETIFVGVVRCLAAVCPTPRARQKTATTALKLHHGEQIYAEK